MQPGNMICNRQWHGWHATGHVTMQPIRARGPCNRVAWHATAWATGQAGHGRARQRAGIEGIARS